MAEIIRQGKLPEDTWYTHECYSCHTLYKFQKKEAVYAQGDGMGHPGGHELKCPFCRTTNVVKMEKTNEYQEPGTSRIDPY